MISGYTKNVINDYKKNKQFLEEGYEFVFVESQNTVIIDNEVVPKCFIEGQISDDGSARYRYYHYDACSGEYTDRWFCSSDEVLYMNYLVNNRPEKLKALIDSGNFYLAISRRLNKAKRLVDKQVDEWLKTDKYIEIARRNGDEDLVYRLKNNLKARAKEEVYRTVLLI